MMRNLPLRRRLPATWIGLALWAAVAAVVTPATGRASLEPGAVAPNFELPTVGGGAPLALNKVEGDRLVVLVWANQRFTTETLAICRRLAGRLHAIKKPWQPILVWEGPLPSRSAGTSLTLGQAWRVVQDADGRVGQSYQMVVSPTIYLLDPQGRITHVFTGWHPLLETQLLGILALTLQATVDHAPPNGPERVNPQDRAALYFNMGRAMAEQGLWEEALGYFESGLKIEPEAVNPLAEAARSAYMTANRDKARDYAERALHHDPEHLLARAVIANLEGHPTPLRWDAGTTGTMAPAASADQSSSATLRK